MRTKARIQKKNIICAFSLGAILCLLAIMQNITDWLPRYPDPFGYLADALCISGSPNDWTGITGAMESYYSYGYGILISPLFIFIEDFLILSKTIISINIVIFISLYYMLIRISHRFINIDCPIVNYSICFVICLYPALLYRISFLIPELFLTFLTAVSILLFIKMEEKPQIIYSILLGMLFPYMISVHGRCAGMCLVASALFVTLFFCKKIKLRHLISYFVVTCIGLFFYKYFDGYLKETIYLLGETTKIKNTFLDTIYIIINSFSFQGLWHVFCTMTAQLFYLGSTTFLLYFVGYISQIDRLYLFSKRRLRKDRETQYNVQEEYIFTKIFIFASALSIICLSSIIFQEPRRIDQLLYGRHNEMFLPFIVLCGFSYILKEEHQRIFIFFWSSVALLICTFFAYYRLENNNCTISIPRTIPALSIFYDNLIHNSSVVFIIFFLVMAVLLFYIFLRKYYSERFAGISVLIIFGCIGMITTYNATMQEKIEYETYRAPYWEIAELPLLDDVFIYAVKSNVSYSNAYLVQLLFMKKHINYMKEDEIISDILQNNRNAIIFSDQTISLGTLENLWYVTDLLSQVEGCIWIYGEEYAGYLVEKGFMLEKVNVNQ